VDESPVRPVRAVPGRGIGKVLRRACSATVLLVGSLALLVLLDLLVGMAWESIAGPAAPAAVAVDPVNFSGSTHTTADPRADLPAMADYPWADRYFREIQLTPNSYWPFTESRPRDFEGEFVTISNWERRSYEPPGNAERMPVVWMFGGSTTWGEGQRDEYTVASHLARLAERDAVPLRIQNFGQRGWTHFQEMILFEQLLAEREAPDLALFYDGTNEINAQSLSVKGVPSHSLVDQYAEILAGGPVAGAEEPAVPPSPTVRAWRSYTERSAIRRAVRAIDDGLFAAAGASSGRAAVAAGGGEVFVTTPEDVARAVEVYERGRSLTETLAEEYGVEPVFVWHPMTTTGEEAREIDRVGSPTVNLRTALDDSSEVYIDGAHTNERGAELAAERLWSELRVQVQRWYDSSEGRGATRGSAPTSSSTTTSTTAPGPSGVRDREALASAAASLERATDDPCALERWKVWLGSLRAHEPADVLTLAQLAQRYLRALADAAPSEAAPAAEAMREMVEGIPALVATEVHDPALPLMPQLSLAGDSRFLAAFRSISESIVEQCGGGDAG
jgi:hypothetical protein